MRQPVVTLTTRLKTADRVLQSLLIEIPDDTLDEKVSWRRLIGRRDVIAHGLLTVDDNRVQSAAVQDFGLLGQWLSKVYMLAIVKTSFASGQGFMPLFKPRILTDGLVRQGPARPHL